MMRNWVWSIGLLGAVLILAGSAGAAEVVGAPDAESAGEAENWVYTPPVSASDHYRLGRHYHDTGNFEMMLLEFRKYLQLMPDDYRGMNNVGVAYALLGHYELARIMWERTLEIRPDDEFARDNIRYMEKILRDPEAASKKKDGQAGKAKSGDKAKDGDKAESKKKPKDKAAPKTEQ